VIDFAGAAIGFVLMLGMMAFGLHVAVAIFLTSVLGAIVYFGSGLLGTFATQLWAVMNDFILTAIPLFVLLGELLMRAGVTQRMYNGLSTWLGRLRWTTSHQYRGERTLCRCVRIIRCDGGNNFHSGAAGTASPRI
jgi:TRAP-type mannitol/chloroaromatic compound transport system permease large subunit